MVTMNSTRKKEYLAPPGVWKNSGGYISTVYINKRRIYGPLRQTLTESVRDREQMLLAKERGASEDEIRELVVNIKRLYPSPAPVRRPSSKRPRSASTIPESGLVWNGSHKRKACKFNRRLTELCYRKSITPLPSLLRASRKTVEYDFEHGVMSTSNLTESNRESGLSDRVQCGAKVVVAAKTVEPTPTLPGTIYTVAREIEEAGGVVLPLQLDLRDAESCEKCVAAVIAKFGRIDILINNASAMWWHSMEQTPIRKFDLITSINSRGSFIMTKLCLPHMKKNNYGRVINMSPPISTHFMSYRGLTAYNISKFGMTMSALGAAAEGQGHNVTGNCLWPATVVESQAATNFELGKKDDWRKSTILADCVLCIVNDPELTGEMLIDDEYLTSSRVGLTQGDLAIYRKNPAVEPRRHLAEAAQKGKSFGERVSRGDIRQVAVDKMRSMI
ncbi:short-chain dehydrogenase, putative [Perkinsus marinus ATCC 50983]|uniref:Short-chain dehydrogenase, putative n=1 Tax=Perkinsus marinus (strain ATCC 50983 / TXsc) TaxID=423536 RepID=C5L5M7_PERM5|nr:short-chain dehydrogenase, putative [Perkinsus marinus ATCC 50983]EER07961.1 short-chain dehydrogenase, putative [Perkinsus marinus ATCC 50983]|eukprot:XP_002776145.1 short-chain dehydrogenase, putative [Perkinsus marinus ATCC 50983]